MLYETPRKRIARGTWVCAEFGIRNGYMTLTGQEWARERGGRDCLSCGQIRSEVLEAFPLLAPVAAWHLATGGEPMHYIANAQFWFDMHTGKRERKQYDPDPVPAFAATIHYGAIVETLSVDQMLVLAWPALEYHLAQRREAMRASFASVEESLPALATSLRAAGRAEESDE